MKFVNTMKHDLIGDSAQRGRVRLLFDDVVNIETDSEAVSIIDKSTRFWN